MSLTLAQRACLQRLAEAGATTERHARRPAGVQMGTLAALAARGLVAHRDVLVLPRPHPVRPWPHPLRPRREWRFTPDGLREIEAARSVEALDRVARRALRHKLHRALRGQAGRDVPAPAI